MFGRFKAAPYQDVQLGTLTRSAGYWIGAIELPRLGDFKLQLSGDRKGPDATALAMARELPGRFGLLVSQIQESLFEHYQPYQEAVVAGELPLSKPLPEIKGADAVWRYASPVHVLIEPLEGIPTIEVAFEVAWDEEHMLGARIQEWRLIELCGSV